MAFGECPICGEKYHLRIADAHWYVERGLQVGEVLKENCYPCFKELEEGDVGEIISIPEGVTDVELVDCGTVVKVHENKENGPAFEIECILPDGRTTWRGTMHRSDLKYVFPK